MVQSIYFQPFFGFQKIKHKHAARSGICLCGTGHDPIERMRLLIARANQLDDRILASTIRAREEVSRLSLQHQADLIGVLKTAEKEIKDQIKDLAVEVGSLTYGERLQRLESIKAEIDGSIDRVFSEGTLQPLFLEQVSESTIGGMASGAYDLVDAQARGGWGLLNRDQVYQAATSAFGVVDTAALEFFSAYRLELAGKVGTEIKDKIKGRLSLAMINGEPLSEVHRQLGRFVKDPDKFKEAGTWEKNGFNGRIFPSASDRLRLIVNTENARMHGQGRLVFYDQVGVGHARWLAFGDNCPICAERHNQIYKLSEFPNFPAHPDCDCDMVGEVDTAAKTPEEMGVILEESYNEKYVSPKQLTDEKREKIPGHQAFYKTDAPEGYKSFVRGIANKSAGAARNIGLPIEQPLNGIEFHWTKGFGKGAGAFEPGLDRINVSLLNRNGTLRTEEEIVASFLEEAAHRYSLKKGWFKIDGGKWVPQEKLPEIFVKAFEITPASDRLYTDKFMSENDEGKELAQFSAKMIRASAIWPDEFRKAGGEYKKLRNEIRKIFGG